MKLFIMATMKLNQGLDSKTFLSGLNEICHCVRESQPDDYTLSLLNGLEEANQRLFDSMHVGKQRPNVQQESRLFNDAIVAAYRFIDSFCYMPDADVKASAHALKKLFNSFGKSIVRMDVGSKMSVAEVLLDRLARPEMAAHVAKLPMLQERISGIRDALDTLCDKQLEVDRVASGMVKPEPLAVLKREAAERLDVLVAYLQVMATKAPEAYGKCHAVVTQVIRRLNATYTGGAPKASGKKAGDDDETEETLKVPIGA